MNYTPLPDIPESVEAPMAFSTVQDGGGHKALIIGSIIILFLVIGALAYSVFKPQKSSPAPSQDVITPTPTTFFDYSPSPVPTEEIILLDLPESSTNEAGISPTYAPSDPKNTTGSGGNNSFPQLPEAGISMPIMAATFLSGFIILVGFVL